MGSRVHGVIDQAGRLVADAGSKGRKRIKLEADVKQEDSSSSTQVVPNIQVTFEVRRVLSSDVEPTIDLSSPDQTSQRKVGLGWQGWGICTRRNICARTL